MTSSYSIEEARAILGDLVTAARSGQTIVITRYGKPAAQLTGIQTPEEERAITRFNTDGDAKAEIIAAIEAGGPPLAYRYDVDAIFREAYGWRVDSHGGAFEQCVDVDEFWAIVARHDRG